jgi:hypothetical protein
MVATENQHIPLSNAQYILHLNRLLDNKIDIWQVLSS